MILWALAASSYIDSAHGQTLAPNRQRQPLNVTLETDKKFYELGDKLTVEVKIKNVSQGTTYLYEVDCGESASLSLWLKDAVSGMDIQPDSIPDALPPPPSSKSSFSELPASQIRDTEFTATLAELGVIKNGRYQLVVTYHSPITKRSSFGLPMWTREDGDIESNRVTIQVGR